MGQSIEKPATNLNYSLYYRNWHNETPEHFAKMTSHFMGLFRPWLPEIRGGAALDIGCGMGFALEALKRLGYPDCRGIDTDPEQVNACQRLGGVAELVDDSVAYLSNHTEKFQLITLFDVLEHVPVDGQVQLLRAIYTALIPGGRLILQVPNANSPLAVRWRYNDYTHHSSFTEYSLRFVLENAYFQTINIQRYERIPFPSFKIWRADIRSDWWRWALYRAWRKFFELELGQIDDLNQIPLTLNITGVAVKSEKVLA